jgi:HK97 family phage prohead protease
VIQFEQRPITEVPEFRSVENGTRIVASGIAMRYGAKSRPIHNPARGTFREEFRSGAFARSIGQQDVRAHLEHGGPFLARTGSGTMRLTDDRSALAYEIDLPNTGAGRDAAELLERRDVAGSSIGFRAISKQTAWSVDEDGMALRSVGEAQLVVVDLTVAPAYPDSTAEMALRSLADDLGVEVRSLMDAPDLAAILDPEHRDDQEHEEDEDTRPPATVRAPISSLYL